MTGTCPICNNRIEATFGMIQCSKCQSMLFIDFSGNIVVGGNDAESDHVLEVESQSHENINHFENINAGNNDFDSDHDLDPDTDIQDIELTTNEYSQVIDRAPREAVFDPSASHPVLDSNPGDNFTSDYSQNLNQSVNNHSNPNPWNNYSQSASEQGPSTVGMQEDFSILSQSNEPNEQVLVNEINSSNENAEPITAMS